MSFAHGKTGKLYVSGVSIGSYFNALDRDGAKDLHDTTCFGDGGHKWTPGLRDGSLTLEGFFEDAAADPYFEAFVDAANRDDPEPFIFAPQGVGGTPSNPCIFGIGRFKNYKIVSAAADMVKVTCELVAEDPGMFSGVCYPAGGPTNQNFSGNNVLAFAALDRGASAPTASVKVAALYMDDFANTGTMQFFSRLQHSADNVSFVNANGNVGSSTAWGVASGGRFTGRGLLMTAETAATLNRYVNFLFGPVGTTTTNGFAALAVWT